MFSKGDVVLWDTDNSLLSIYNGSLAVVESEDQKGVHLLYWVSLNDALGERLNRNNVSQEWRLRNWMREQWKKVGHIDVL